MSKLSEEQLVKLTAEPETTRTPTDIRDKITEGLRKKAEAEGPIDMARQRRERAWSILGNQVVGAEDTRLFPEAPRRD